ncbi:MAG: GTP pyrophosphokinase [Clostridium sp.]|nr:GTP pyrophosphokinase [Clostridium sp.]MCM1172783.1 GTP pyrophosphokinase [Clostridium sp.]MCM1208173.1 GTP pyrophosphokinase [Ruminococcus sp.]
MIYTALTKRAMEICYRAHDGQLDKGGIPYVFHPFHIAEQMEDEYSICVALLHDTVEDGGIELSELYDAGFPEEIVKTVDILTRRTDEPYMDYIERLKENSLAVKVKLADLHHNSDMTRLNIITKQDMERKEKYEKAIEVLERACRG